MASLGSSQLLDKLALGVEEVRWINVRSLSLSLWGFEVTNMGLAVYTWYVVLLVIPSSQHQSRRSTFNFGA